MPRKLYIIQETAGSDGVFHWKIMLAYEGATGLEGIWCDVVWLSEMSGWMDLRGPENFVAEKSQGFIQAWPIGELPDATGEQDFRTAVEAAHRPDKTPDDITKGLDCQTWAIEVVFLLLGKDGVDAAAKVPRKN